jgi:hypothetical protein
MKGVRSSSLPYSGRDRAGIFFDLAKARARQSAVGHRSQSVARGWSRPSGLHTTGVVPWASAPKVPQRLKPPVVPSACSAKALLHPRLNPTPTFPSGSRLSAPRSMSPVPPPSPPPYSNPYSTSQRQSCDRSMRQSTRRLRQIVNSNPQPLHRLDW